MYKVYATMLFDHVCPQESMSSLKQQEINFHGYDNKYISLSIYQMMNKLFETTSTSLTSTIYV